MQPHTVPVLHVFRQTCHYFWWLTTPATHSRPLENPLGGSAGEFMIGTVQNVCRLQQRTVMTQWQRPLIQPQYAARQLFANKRTILSIQSSRISSPPWRRDTNTFSEFCSSQNMNPNTPHSFQDPAPSSAPSLRAQNIPVSVRSSGSANFFDRLLDFSLHCMNGHAAKESISRLTDSHCPPNDWPRVESGNSSCSPVSTRRNPRCPGELCGGEKRPPWDLHIFAE